MNNKSKMKPKPQGRMGKINGGCAKACQKKLLQATRYNEQQKSYRRTRNSCFKQHRCWKGWKPITIPLSDVSPELKAILVKEMIKGGGLKWLRVRVR